ncbi:MAG TPA: alanine racemase [Micromonosporaceae bacterium]
MWQAEARIDLAAIRQNVARLKQGTSAELMAVVKADGYGHGMVPAARASLAAGASWLGVCTLEEALALRDAGITAPVLAWLVSPGLELHRAVAADVDLSVASGGLLDEVVTAARRVSRPARVHLKVDTGLTRGGATVADWPTLLEAVAKAQADGAIETVGIWSHFAYADAPGHPTITRQIAVFREALEAAARLGVRPAYRHLANSAATLTLPEAHFDLVRPGIAVYGLSPIHGTTAAYGLRPAMTLRARVMLAKRVPGGSGVSYGHAYTTPRETTVAVIPLGYADGITRAAGNAGPLLLGGKRRQIAGRVCMDQFVVDVGDDEVSAGDMATIFGPGDHGEPTADDWAEVLDTISYEVVTRIGPRVPRVYDGEVDVDGRERSETGT